MKLKTIWLGIAAIVLTGVSVFAADASFLKPPAGAQVAVVVFEDLECPSCAKAYPVIWETANAQHVPVMLYDFPLRQHPWSMDAAVDARYFDTKSQKLGNEFRGYIYENQPNITMQNLHDYVQKFADEHKTPLPFAVDPEGKLKEKIEADRSLGEKAGLVHTPTVFVIGRSSGSTPFTEVTDMDKLGQAIEDMKKKAEPAAPAKTAHSTKHRKRSS
jgi:protein-disulfide isomerase